MIRRPRQPAGFSLIELLLVIAIMAIVSAVVLPNSNPSVHDQLQAAAKIVAGDLAYARSLAVTHNSTYRVDFDTRANRYVLTHSGSDASLDELPDSPWRNPDDPADEHIVCLEELPRLGSAVKVAAVAEGNDPYTRTGYVEFGPLGETTRSAPSVVWLKGGSGDAERYLMLAVNPVTGLVSVGPFTAEPPKSMVAAPTL